MSLGRPGLFVLIKDYAFPMGLGHESVLPVGYPPATRRIPVAGRAQKTIHQTLAGSSEIALGRARANLGPTWGHLGANLSQLEPKSVDLGSKSTHLASKCDDLGSTILVFLLKCCFWGSWILVFL